MFTAEARNRMRPVTLVAFNLRLGAIYIKDRPLRGHVLFND